MIQNFDITMTATLRPELIKITLDSHIENLFKEDIKKAKLIINVDLAGAEEKYHDSKSRDVFLLVDKYPFRAVEMRVGNPPFFPAAFHWCWDHAKMPFVFHLEEDWEMMKPLNFSQMWSIMEKDSTLAHLRLSYFPSTEISCKNWNKFTYWNGEYFEVPCHDKCVIGWCGHPSLNRLSFMRKALSHSNRMANPEKQIKGRRGSHPINYLLDANKFGVFTPQDSSPIVRDIGRRWMVEHGYVKAGVKAFFTNWATKE